MILPTATPETDDDPPDDPRPADDPRPIDAPYLIDSHCHLDFPDFDDERDAVIARAHRAGVGLMIGIGVSYSRRGPILDLAARHPSVYATAGIHPNEVAEADPIDVEDLVALAAAHPKLAGFGETGLDAHYTGDHLIRQEESFRIHIEAARRCDLPVVIHSRNVDADMERILLDEAGKKPFKAVLHCFGSGQRLADVGVELGLFISFSGILTFKNAENLRAVAKTIPLENLLVETDSPYLAPTPHRGKRNEPAYVALTARRLAELHDISPDEAARRTSANCLALFSRIAPQTRFVAAS